MVMARAPRVPHGGSQMVKVLSFLLLLLLLLVYVFAAGPGGGLRRKSNLVPV
jgi:hypothetical protein